MATVRVTRDRERSPDRRLVYGVFVDGEQAGELPRGETRDFAVGEGAHLVTVAADPGRAESREWEVVLRAADTVHFCCRSRTKWANHVDLYLADAGDTRARVRPPSYLAERDVAKRQRVVARDGQVFTVWAHRSGYLRSLDPGSGQSSGDAYLLELALYVLVLPVLGVLRWVRHRLLFKRGWSVGVVRSRRFLWPKKVRLDRYGTEAEARAKASELIAELEGHTTGPPRPSTTARP